MLWNDNKLSSNLDLKIADDMVLSLIRQKHILEGIL